MELLLGLSIFSCHKSRITEAARGPITRQVTCASQSVANHQSIERVESEITGTTIDGVNECRQNMCLRLRFHPWHG